MEQTKLVNLDLSATKGTVVQVNGDPNAQFTLNLSDFGIYGRLSDGLDKLYALFTGLKEKMGDIAGEEIPDSPEDVDGTEDIDNDVLLKFAEVMKDTDAQMRNVVDYIFSAPVSDICAPNGYMFDLFEGQLRFEYIINALTKLYENNINAEFYKVKARINPKLPQYVTKSGN